MQLGHHVPLSIKHNYNCELPEGQELSEEQYLVERLVAKRKRVAMLPLIISISRWLRRHTNPMTLLYAIYGCDHKQLVGESSMHGLLYVYHVITEFMHASCRGKHQNTWCFGYTIVFPIKICTYLKWTQPNDFVKNTDGTVQPKQRTFVEIFVFVHNMLIQSYKLLAMCTNILQCV